MYTQGVVTMEVDGVGVDYTTNISGSLDEFFINSDTLSGTEIDTIYERGVAPTLVGSPTATSFDDSTVSGGNLYYYTVQSVNAVGSSESTSAVSGLAGSPPDAPTSVSTAINAPNSAPLDVTVSWSAPTNVGTGTLSSFEVYRDGTLITTTGLVTSYADTVPSGGGTFVYSLKAISNHGSSVLSATSSITTATVPPTPTATPTLAINSPNPSPFDVDVSWTAQSSGGSAITGYEIFRSADDITFTSVGTVTDLDFTDTVPTEGTWYYTFASTNLIGSSGQSPSSSITTATVPTAITDLAASTVSDTAINLTWGVPSNGGSDIVDYTLYRDGVLIDTSSTPGFSDVSLTQQTSYDYTVYARNNVGLSLISNSVTQFTHGVPAAVSPFTATTAAIDQINLTWTAPNDYNSAITNYIIERESPVGNGFAPLITLGPVTSYSDPGLISVTEYNYRIKAVNGYGNSPTTTASTITLPAPPTNVIVTPSSSPSELTVTWTTPTLTTGITGYQILREDGIGTGFSPITVASGTTFTDTGLTTNIYYNYKLASVTVQGNSGYSDTYSQTSFHLPMGVQSLTATSGDLIDAGLSWSSPTVPYGYITGYEIYQSTTGTPNVLIDSTTATSYTATDLDPTVTYYWLVAPVTIHGTNSTGNIANATATSEIVIGDIIVSKDVNPTQASIKFDEVRNGNSTSLAVTYATGTNLSCEFDHKFARTNYTHGNLAETFVSTTESSHTFTFNNSANEIISVHCYDQDTNPGGNTVVNAQDDGQFQINFATQPIVTQVNDFQKGAFGISSGFGAFDLMTLFVVLISMVGFNRKNPAVGIGIMVSFIGAMGYFGIIEPPTIVMGILAVVVVVSIGQVRKNR
jgi:titin